MTRTDLDGAIAFNQSVIDEFRANGGHVGGTLAGSRLLLLHHVGARSHLPRVTPLMFTPHGSDGYLVVASNGGAATHPSWYFNVRAQSRTTIELGAETLTVRVNELEGAARAEIWPALLAASPTLREFDARATRAIPV